MTLATGASTTTDLGTCTLEVAIQEDFVDSPAALNAALSGGFKTGETINFTLSHKYDENLNPSRPCWTVYSPENDFDSNQAVMRGWCVDPKTGKFVTPTVGKGGRNR